MIEPPARRRSTTAQAATPRPARLRTPVLLTMTALGGLLLAGCSGNGSTPAAAPSTSPWSVASQPASGATSGPGASGSGSGPAGASGGSGPAGGSGPSGSAGTGATGATGAQDDGSGQRGVPPDVTDLPPQQRIHQPPGASTRVRTPQGIWVVSAPETAAAAVPAGSPTPSSSPSGYGELLLLDPSGSRVLRAYPFRGLAPQWVIVAPDAVYCGRRGTAAAPDAMICRVDRSTGELRVRVLPDGGPSTVTTQNDLTGRPGRWVLDFRSFTVDFGRTPELTGTELIFRGSGSVALHVSRDTLQVLGS